MHSRVMIWGIRLRLRGKILVKARNILSEKKVNTTLNYWPICPAFFAYYLQAVTCTHKLDATVVIKHVFILFFAQGL